jgi:hypothetical protein
MSFKLTKLDLHTHLADQYFMAMADRQIRTAHGDDSVAPQSVRDYPDYVYERAVKQAEIRANSDPRDI